VKDTVVKNISLVSFVVLMLCCGWASLTRYTLEKNAPILFKVYS